MKIKIIIFFILMIILVEDIKLKFNIDLKNKYNFKYDNMIIDYNKFYDFLQNCLHIKNNFADLLSSEESFYDFFQENLEYLNFSINPFSKRNIYSKLGRLLLDNEWLRRSKYIKMKLCEKKYKDLNFIFLKLIIDKLENNQKRSYKKILKKNNTNINLSFNDFLYDYYN
jgi:hypothetical protein